jgi:hypothetical protein
MTVLQFYATVFFVALVWIVGTFFWLRLVAAVLLLAVWGAAAFILPLALAMNYLGEGRVLAATAVVLVAAIPAYLFAMTSRFAVRWLERERERGGFARPLFARD